MSVRKASHAGSWYSSSKAQLSSQLDGWLNAVSAPVKCIGAVSSSGEPVAELPVPRARVIIAPKRVFLLGPSHHFYLSKCALSKHTAYETPLGNLPIDRETTEELYASKQFQWMSKSVDEEEHSLEMHLPYIYKVLSLNFSDEASFPKLVPIMVGNTTASTEKSFGQLLAPFLADPGNAFVISSDFAHWGLRFRYTYYDPSPANETGSSTEPYSLKQSDSAPTKPAIHESIRKVDFQCIDACESGSHAEWLDVLERTGNTVCGRHPIGILMAAVEALEERDKGKFRFVRYERSSEVKRIDDSSVSYASAFAVV
ncbi:hypothetical protein LTR66_008801 [Elasticomyces elasticus]|nr:hypothetical protein LTR66_008801 [Elasticomyces elasticus]KAK4990092.1 hypothetical protein LTR50_002721 [Elasticomyces elasticus]KAK5006350.1 hypothetical protein LTR28_006596 [Elasticomyces elasticus]